MITGVVREGTVGVSVYNMVKGERRSREETGMRKGGGRLRRELGAEEVPGAIV
jgi:hypothetical protein